MGSLLSPLAVPPKEILPVFDPSRAFVRLSPTAAAEQSELPSIQITTSALAPFLLFAGKTIVALCQYFADLSKTYCNNENEDWRSKNVLLQQ